MGSRIEVEVRNLKVAFYPGDLNSAAAVDRLFDSVLKDFGKLDIVVKTVGKVLKKLITDIAEEEYNSMFAVEDKEHYHRD